MLGIIAAIDNIGLGIVGIAQRATMFISDHCSGPPARCVTACLQLKVQPGGPLLIWSLALFTNALFDMYST